jgi:hypothetical protein
MKINLNKENAYIDKYCLEAQAELIFGPEVLDYFSTSELENLVPMWAKSLRVGGKIVLGGTDLYILAKNAINREKELVDINEILFNRNNELKSLTSIESTKDFLVSLGFSISNINLSYDTCTYYVEAYKK